VTHPNASGARPARDICGNGRASARRRRDALEIRTRVDVEDIRVVDVGCHADAAPLGGEETGDRWRLVLPVRGVFTCHTRGVALVAEPGCAIVLGPDEPYRFGHPIDGGDDCVLIAPEPQLWHEVTSSIRAAPTAGRRVVLDGDDLLRTMRLRVAPDPRDGPDAVRELAILHFVRIATRLGGGHEDPVPSSRRKIAREAAAFVGVHHARALPRLLDAAARPSAVRLSTWPGHSAPCTG